MLHAAEQAQHDIALAIKSQLPLIEAADSEISCGRPPFQTKKFKIVNGNFDNVSTGLLRMLQSIRLMHIVSSTASPVNQGHHVTRGQKKPTSASAVVSVRDPSSSAAVASPSSEVSRNLHNNPATEVMKLVHVEVCKVVTRVRWLSSLLPIIYNFSLF